MTGLSKLTLVEFKLMLRDPVSLFVVLALPIGFLMVFGLGFRGNPNDLYLPSLQVALALGMAGVFTLPTYLAGYREKGILRRLSTTPVHPAMLLVTQLVINLILAMVAMALVIGLSNVVLGIPAPKNVLGFLIAFVLGVSALFSMGLLIAAVARHGRAASAIGSLLLYPSLFFAGAWLPRSQMPAILARIGEYTPLAATQEMLQAAWTGSAPRPLQMVAMVVISAIIGAAATRIFRWD